MVSKAIACLLIALTFVSPSACCCSFEAAADWVLAGIFQETGIRQSANCCHQLIVVKTGCDASLPCCQQHRDDDHSRHCDGSQDDSHHCPCQDDGTPGTGIPSTLDMHAASGAFSANSLLQLYVVPTLAIYHGCVSSMATELSAPRGLRENGQGILRAYGRLRI